jgi:hypothetical protein
VIADVLVIRVFLSFSVATEIEIEAGSIAAG